MPTCPSFSQKNKLSLGFWHYLRITRERNKKNELNVNWESKAKETDQAVATTDSGQTASQ